MFKPESPFVAIRGHVFVFLASLALASVGCDSDVVSSTPDAGSADSGRSDAAAPPIDAADGGTVNTAGRDAGQADSGATPVEVIRGNTPADDTPDVDDAEYAKLIMQLNKFGLDLGRKQAELNELTKSNIVYSPLSASIALSMTYVGAKAKTADAFKSVLSGEVAADHHHAGINRLARELAARERNFEDPNGTVRKIELNIADAVYADKTVKLQESFLDQLSRNYESGVSLEDFVNAPEPARLRINDWVADKTRDRIKDLLPPDSIDSLTRLVLVNAMYFYGSWASPFLKQRTRDAEFRTLDNMPVTVPTMHGGGSWQYSQGEGFVGVELPYTGNELHMFVVLPDEGQFEAVRKAASAEWLKTALASATPRAVSLALPKFEMTVAFTLGAPLVDLGLGAAFSAGADFTGISEGGGMWIGEVYQKAFIGVDEAGTEAAAATAVTLVASSAPTDVVELVVDRPFLFFIHDLNGVVLFSGQVVDPTQK